MASGNGFILGKVIILKVCTRGMALDDDLLGFLFSQKLSSLSHV